MRTFAARARSTSLAEFSLDGWWISRLGGGPVEIHASDVAAVSHDIAQRLSVSVSQPISVLARWIVDRRVVVLPYGADMVLPLFQFDFARGCLRSGVALVIAELSGAMTDDEIARWFVDPNGWLNGAVPAASCAFDIPAVLTAARADRWAVKG